jgi:exodeoxyribonuclease V beta subunit
MTTFSLSDVPGSQLQPELEFFFKAGQGMMKGFADLFFEFEGKYYLLDWKSNYLGPSNSDYTQEKIAEAMLQHQYYMQASIYADALDRYVKLFDKRPFSECFGGAIYYFVRGRAIHHFFPEPYFKDYP